METKRIDMKINRIDMKKGGHISSAKKKIMKMPAWSSFVPNDEYEKRALEIIKMEMEKANKWLVLASEHISTLLPIGYGIGGSGGCWSRVAVFRNGQLGILNVADGIIGWTDTDVPSYVRRFMIPTDTASMGSASHQINMTYYHLKESPKISPLPKPKVIEIEYGLQNCYGTIGRQINKFKPSIYPEYTEWVYNGAKMVETPIPQYARILYDVHPIMIDGFNAPHRFYRMKKSGLSVGGQSLINIEIYGTYDERSERKNEFLTAWNAHTAKKIKAETEKLNKFKGFEEK